MPTMTRQRPLISGLFYFMKTQEIWKDIPNYEGKYQASNLGRVKSLNYNRTKVEKILSPGVNSRGYLTISLCKNSKTKTFTIHQIMAITFLNHKLCGMKLVIHHVNDNPLDNRLENLQVTTQRDNARKTQGKYTSQYKGVSWVKNTNKWKARIQINKKEVYLGIFNCELKASLAYQEELKKII